jgi:hypothetical protein
LLVSDGAKRLQCRRCRAKFSGSQLLARIQNSPCKGWRLVRDGRLCYARSIGEVAPRFGRGFGSEARPVTGATVTTTSTTAPRAAAHGLDDPDWCDDQDDHGIDEPVDGEPPCDSPPAPGADAGFAGREEAEGVLAAGSRAAAPPDRLSGRCAADALAVVERQVPLPLYASAFERQAVGLACVTGISSLVHRSHTIGAEGDAVFCVKCGSHSFGARFVLLRKECRAPTAAGASFLAGIRQSGVAFIRRTSDARRRCTEAKQVVVAAPCAPPSAALFQAQVGGARDGVQAQAGGARDGEQAQAGGLLRGSPT